jgi:hypothetical protein
MFIGMLADLNRVLRVSGKLDRCEINKECVLQTGIGQGAISNGIRSFVVCSHGGSLNLGRRPYMPLMKLESWLDDPLSIGEFGSD